MLLFILSRLCFTVLRKNGGDGKWVCKETESEEACRKQKRQKHFALDFVRRSQSVPFILASCLPHFSSTERNSLFRNTHTEANINMCLTHSLTQTHTDQKEKHKKEVIFHFSIFLPCILRHDKLYVQTVDENRQTAEETTTPLLSVCPSVCLCPVLLHRTLFAQSK